jgi:hypothetical protein
MSEERKILELLSSGQITVDEAEKLLQALRDLDTARLERNVTVKHSPNIRESVSTFLRDLL